MKMKTVTEYLGDKDRQFGFVISLFIAILGIIYLGSNRDLVICFAICLGIVGVSHKAPNLISPFTNLWLKFGVLLGRVVSPIIMGLIYFVVVGFFAIIIRLIGRDYLRYSVNKKIDSTWIHRKDSDIKFKEEG